MNSPCDPLNPSPFNALISATKTIIVFFFKWGVPQNHPCFNRISIINQPALGGSHVDFHEINHPASWGNPPAPVSSATQRPLGQEKSTDADGWVKLPIFSVGQTMENYRKTIGKW